MNELNKVFNTKETENGDLAYTKSGNKYLDILFGASYYRDNLSKIPEIGTEEYDKLFAMFIRDPRFGMGERDLGRKLVGMSENFNIKDILTSGRADDLIALYNDVDVICGHRIYYMTQFLNLLKEGNYYAKKWAPRLTSGKEARALAKLMCSYLKISQSKYRKLIKCDTTEDKMCNNNFEKIEFAKVPSLSFAKNLTAFFRHDKERIESFLKEVSNGTNKINTATLSPYDIYKKYTKSDAFEYDAIDILFNQLEHVELGKILPIIDCSWSMEDNTDSMGKAKAIGHYVSKNSSYCNNFVIPFSSDCRLLELSNTYEKDMEILDSFHDYSNTNLASVVTKLKQLKNDIPEFLLILSDMEFDTGSNSSKDSLMEYYKSIGANTKIIWWNLSSDTLTFPETDDYGNIFMSGYNPTLLKFLESGFNGKQFLDKMLTEYKKKIESIS